MFYTLYSFVILISHDISKVHIYYILNGTVASLYMCVRGLLPLLLVEFGLRSTGSDFQTCNRKRPSIQLDRELEGAMAASCPGQVQLVASMLRSVLLLDRLGPVIHGDLILHLGTANNPRNP